MGLKKLFAQSILWRGFYFFSILVVNVFLSRYLRAANTGNLYLISVIFSFIQTVLSLSVESGIVYFASGNIIERNKLISLMGLWSFAAGIIMIGLVYVYFSIDASLDKTLLLPYILYGFFYVCGQSLTNYAIAIYYTQENYFLPNFLLGLVNLVFVTIIPGKNSVMNAQQVQHVMTLYFSTFLVAGLLVYCSYIIKNRSEGAFTFPDKKNFNLLLKYSITALGANVVFFLVYKVDYLFVNYSPVCTKADLGNYIQVSKLGQMMLVVPQIMASVVFPRTASGIDNMRMNNVIMIIARILSQVFFVAFIITAILGKQIFILLFGESFNKMQLPMLIIIPGIFSLSVVALLSAYFSGKGKIKINLYGAIIGLSVMIIGDFIFVPRYGIVAAAVISTLSYTANFCYSLYHFYLDHSIHWVEFVRWRKDDYNWLIALIKRNTNLL
jgi:O-antigen/teichoic acid export membrane protein